MTENSVGTRPMIFLSCSLTHASKDFVREMLALQAALGERYRTNSWSVDPTRPSAENEDDATCKSIFAHDTALLRQADAVVVEVSHPSTGSGIEVGIAAELGLPILVVAPAGVRVSPFIRGIPQSIYREYTHASDILRFVESDLVPRIRP